ncbi:MAG TPA: outer membrane beta-barrel protein [Bacteroidia bacterium]|nr:outer membrane beta-barrel protein [Bacteroidia bacterium]
MKKTLALALLLTAFAFTSNAQAFDDGTNLFSLGFGIPPAQRLTRDFSNNYKTFVDYRLNNYGTFVGKYEHGLHKYFGLGVNIEYSAASVSYKYTQSLLDYERKIKSSMLGGFIRFNGHIPVTDKFDIYGGLGLGYYYTIDKYKDTKSSDKTTLDYSNKVLDFDFQATLGFRYMIKENVGFFAEIGRASTIGQVGCAIKF